MSEEIITKSVERLVARGIDVDIATERVTQAYEKLQETEDVSELPESKIVNILYSVVSKNLAKKASKKDEVVIGVCIGFDRKKDEMDKIKYANLKAASEIFKADGNYKRAINEGIVKYDLDANGEPKLYEREVDGVVVSQPILIPLDNREFIDKAQTMANFNFGNEFIPKYKRFAYFIIDGKLKSVVGDIDPKIGAEYNIHTNNPNGKMIYVNSGGLDFRDTMTNIQLWDFILQYVDDFEESLPLNEIDSASNYQLMVSIGDVVSKPFTKTGKPFLILCNDECVYNVNSFLKGNDELEPYLEEINECNEVIVIGTVQVGTGDYKNSLNLMGIIRNPETDEITSIVDRISGMFNE